MTVIKTKFIYLLGLIFLLLPSMVLMLKNPIYPSHDALIHINRIELFNNSLMESQFPPKLAGEWGFPLFVVNYQLPYYLAEIFIFIFNDATTAFKSVIVLTYILSAVFAFF